jgi:phosphoglycolate phosphatase-like HAD superfamily hydrolase
MHLVMFDIDGTLVDSEDFDGELYAASVRAVLGVKLDRDWDRYEHVSDRGIVEQLLRDRRIEERAALAERVQWHFVALVRGHLARHGLRIREIPGARELVERLLSLPGVRVAVATGGWEETARLKLRHVGIDDERLALASSSDAAARTAIMRLAAQRALRGASAHRTTYFGDGAWDRRASAELGYDFVAVGRATEHAVRYDDLRATETILAELRIVESARAS